MRRYLKEFDFESLFIEELGWDYCDDTSLKLEIDGEVFTLQAVAEKRGMVAFICAVTGAIPPYATRRKIERQVAQSFRQHFIIYADGSRTEQVWQWVKQEVGKPLASREHRYAIQQSGESLIQKLQAIAFSFEEEETLIHVDVTSRVRAAFDVEKVTKKFYDRFKKERDAFQKFLAGIPSEELEQWYVSVMLNRLMFIYFIQKKEFLDNDPDYLRHKLEQSRERSLSRSDSFYPDFLCPLFFEGFARPQNERPPDIRALLGDIPYLNGGIFQRHELERLHGRAIQIPDAAFERLFDFFDQYQWHLDDRPLRDDREINPDVLGYIFEKYINQKQMGAYYTKEDITGYISKNTIIPFLFDEAQKKCRIAFEGETSVWSLLSADPDRYIYEAVRKGTDLPLPLEIAAGIDDVSKRETWNTPTPEEYALPTEIWRETMARRQQYERNRVLGKNSVYREGNCTMSKAISLDQLPSHVESLLRVAWEGHDSIVLERQSEPVAAVVPMEEYLRLHPETKKTEVKPHKEEKLETTEALSTLSYELPAELLKAYNSLLDKKFSSGLTADEEAELAKLNGQLDEAELATPLVQSTLTTAEQQHKQWMRTLDEVITKLRGLRESP